MRIPNPPLGPPNVHHLGDGVGAVVNLEPQELVAVNEIGPNAPPAWRTALVTSSENTRTESWPRSHTHASSWRVRAWRASGIAGALSAINVSCSMVIGRAPLTVRTNYPASPGTTPQRAAADRTARAAAGRHDRIERARMRRRRPVRYVR